MGNKIIEGVNDFVTLQPHLACYLKNYEDGIGRGQSSPKYAVFICPNCGQEKNSSFQKVTEAQRVICTHCSDNLPFGEKYVSTLLKANNINFIHDKTTEWSLKKRYDFYIPSLSMIIETHGEQHFRSDSFKQGEEKLKLQKQNDAFKRDLAINNGVEYYIELDTSTCSEEDITKQLQSTPLWNALTIKETTIAKHSNRMLEVVEFYNNNKDMSTTEIAKKLGYARSTIKNDLKRASKLCLCDYSPETAKKDKNHRNAINYGRKIKAINRFNGKVTCFNSVKEASRITGCKMGSIHNALSGRSKYSGDFYWADI